MRVFLLLYLTRRLLRLRYGLMYSISLKYFFNVTRSVSIIHLPVLPPFRYIIRAFAPYEITLSLTSTLALLPMPTITITLDIPIIMPILVSAERSLFLERALSAVIKTFFKFMCCNFQFLVVNNTKCRLQRCQVYLNTQNHALQPVLL